MTTTPGDLAVFAGSTAQVQITERRPAHPDASGLLRAFHREQVNRYGFADPIALTSGDYAPPRGVFAVAYQDGTQSGAGATGGSTPLPAPSRSKGCTSPPPRAVTGPDVPC